MERLTRLIGIGLIVAAAAASASLFQRTVVAMAPEAAPRTLLESWTDDLAATGSVSAIEDLTDSPPQFLSFRDLDSAERLRSGVYEISNLSTSRDRDVAPVKRVDRDFPIETDLVPHYSLAPRGPLAPGLYMTASEVRDCSYEVRRVNKDRVESIIGSDRLSRGRMIVTLNEIEPDVFAAMPQCGDWVVWSPLVEPLVVASNGDYWIGDLQPGQWEVPARCVWEKVVGFRGAKLIDVEDSGTGPDLLIIDEDTLGVRIRGCVDELLWVRSTKAADETD